MIADAALTTGDTLVHSSQTPGGARFLSHTANPVVFTAIKSQNWDYVTLQAQSQEPSFDSLTIHQDVFPHAKRLCDSIYAANKCVKPLFYMTWGRKNGDSRNCQAIPWVCTYEGMDDSLASRYQYMANQNKALVSPVGRVWRYLRRNHPTIELYSADESHPSANGTYAAMCSFYTMIFKKDPTNITFDASLKAADALTIRNAAKLVVYDSLAKWNVGKWPLKPTANFSSSLSNDTVQFSNNSQKANSYSWNFGDGNNSTDKNPKHIYGDTGRFTIQLLAFACNATDTFTQSIYIPPSTIIDTSDTNDTIKEKPNVLPINLKTGSQIQLFPNPGSSAIEIRGISIETDYSIINLEGSVIGAGSVGTSKTNINVSSLENGLYFIELSNAEVRKTIKWIKQ